MREVKQIPIIRGLDEIASSYEGYIIDLWGTVHNGLLPYEGVIDCLRHLKKEGKKIVFLSNAPRRSYVVATQLAHLGLKPTQYDGLITSGEVTYQLMREGGMRDFHLNGRKMLVIGGLHDVDLYKNLDVKPVEDVEDANFVLNTGPDATRGTASIDPYLPQLDACLKKDLPMICPNPDRVVMKGQQRQICAGALAAYYHQHGGRVVEVGKPFPLVYDVTMKILDMDVAKVLAIGDSLMTDIKGATNRGIDSLWLLGGIHQELLSNEEEKLLEACRHEDVYPSAVMTSLRWGAEESSRP